MPNQRINQIDNIKCFLILLVVFGHILEYVTFKNCEYIYILIYSFHMPAFCFISGYCSNPNNSIKKVFNRYLFPYLVFQTLYLLFDHFALGNTFKLQYTTPYWTLWYLLSLFMWNLILLFVKDYNLKVVFAVGVILSIVCGYDTEICRYLSLSRVFGFFPYFILGHMFRQYDVKLFISEEIHKKSSKRIIIKLITAVVCVAIAIAIFYFQDKINSKWLYSSYSYIEKRYGALHRIVIEMIAISFTMMVCLFASKRRLPLVTSIGKNTMSVYLLHSSIISLLDYYDFFKNLTHPIIVSIVLPIVIVLILSSKPFVKLVSFINNIPMKINNIIKKNKNTTEYNFNIEKTNFTQRKM